MRWQISWRFPLFLLLTGIGNLDSTADDRARSGGETTVVQDGQNAFSLPLANITRENRRAHVIGNSFFNKNWVFAPASTTARDGLGPLFHARSCSECHLRDGRSAPSEGASPLPGLLFRFADPETEDPLSHPDFGRQFAPLAIPKLEPEGRIEIRHRIVAGTFPDGSAYTLREPIYEIASSIENHPSVPSFRLAPRIASPVFGLGLLEAIPESALLKHHDPEDRDGDGISGRVNRVRNPETGKVEIGRFGWKANQVDLRHQTAAAFVDDIGITSSIHPEEDLTPRQRDSYVSLGLELDEKPEIDEKTLERVVRYLQTLAPPARRRIDAPEAIQGEELFHSTGCAACHVPEWTTEIYDSTLPEVGGQLIRPYTDLLLHDMGPSLADSRGDGEATGREWRTPPLWGIGLTETVNGHTSFLHDGRARNLEEAILWHGGEAEAAQRAYQALEKRERVSLLSFLESL